MKAEALPRVAGELAVIVLGVLIALAADRWIQAADARTDERFYITQLASDIRTDSAELEEMVQRSAIRNQTALDLLLYVEADPQLSRDPRRFMTDVRLASVFGTNVAYKTDTWQDLITSGAMSSIRDPALRAELSGYYNEIERVRGLFEEGDNTLSTTLDELLPPLQSLAALNPVFLPPDVGADHQPTSEDAARFLRELASRDDLLADFAGMRRTWTLSLNVHRGLLQQASDLLRQLETDRS